MLHDRLALRLQSRDQLKNAISALLIKLAGLLHHLIDLSVLGTVQGLLISREAILNGNMGASSLDFTLHTCGMILELGNLAPQFLHFCVLLGHLDTYDCSSTFTEVFHDALDSKVARESIQDNRAIVKCL